MMFQWKDTMRVQVTPLHRYSHKRLMSQRVVKPQPREHLGARGSSSKRCGAELPHWQWTYWTRTLGKRVVETTPISSDIPYIAMAICVTMCHMSRIPLVSLSVSIGFFFLRSIPFDYVDGKFFTGSVLVNVVAPQVNVENCILAFCRQVDIVWICWDATGEDTQLQPR